MTGPRPVSYHLGGVFLEPGDDYWTANIDLFVGGEAHHYGVIQCYGRTEDDAKALRDRLMKGLRS